MARIARHQLLRVAHQHLDRAPGDARQVIRERQIHERALAPEVAADRRQVHANLLGRQTQGLRQQFLEAKGHLVRRPHLDPAGVVDRHDPRVGFEIALVVELGAEGVLQDPIGLAEPGLHVSQLEAKHGLDVRVGPLGGGALVTAVEVAEEVAAVAPVEGQQPGRLPERAHHEAHALVDGQVTSC